MWEKPVIEEKPAIKIDVDAVVRKVREQVVEEFRYRCVIWHDINETSTEAELPPKFERVCNQDGDPVFRDSEGTWKSVVTGKCAEVSSWTLLPKREMAK